MRTSDEIKARLHHGSQELRQALQLLTTSSDHIQTAFDEIQVCQARADLIDPAIDALSGQIHTLTEDMDRVYSLRNDESDLYLRQENKHLKRDLAALQQALRHEMEQHRALLTDSAKSNEELMQRVRNLERFTELLKSKLNEMKEQYETAIIDNADLREAFNVTTSTAASGRVSGGTSPGPIPFGKTVVETNRGLTVTIESSPDNSPEKASLHHGWIPELPSGSAVAFPDIAPQPQSSNLTPASGGSTQIAIRPPGRPKSRAIVKGTREANESFERMQRSLTFPPLANSTNLDNDATKPSSSSASGLVVPIIRPFDVHPVTPSKVKSKLNPAVEAFTPSNSSSKDSAKSGSMQASSPTKNEVKSSGNATTTKEEGVIPPHLRRLSKVSINEESVTATEELSVKNKIKDQSTMTTNAQTKSTKVAEPLQTTSLTPRILPHLRRLTNVVKKEDIDPSQVQHSAKGKNKDDTIEQREFLSGQLQLNNMKENVKAATIPGAFVRPDPGLQAWLDSQEKALSNNASAKDPTSLTNDTLIEIDESPKTGKEKTVPLPPGFIPISTNDAPVKTDTAAPITIDRVASPITAHDPVIHRQPTTEDEGAAPWQEVPTKNMSEKDKNAAFLAEYNRKLSTVSEKYGRVSRKGLDAKEDVDPVKYEGANASYVPSKPSGTHKLGALLDDECCKMVLKPRKAVKVEDGQQWKAVRKDGKVVYVL